MNETKKKITKGKAYELLSPPRRRLAVKVIDDHDGGPMSKRELAKKVAEIEGAEYNNVYISIHQTHMGMLEKLGVLESDEVGDEIVPGPHFEKVAKVERYADKVFNNVASN